MSKLKHTGGTWVREGDCIVGERYICQLSNWSIVPAGGQYDAINRALEKERDANAALISAAPDLLAALAHMLGAAEIDGLDDKSNVWRSYMLDARRAIAKSRA